MLMAAPIVYLNGLFWPLDKARISILDRGFTYGDGLFETLRAYSKKIFRLEEHLDRLLKSAHMIFLELPMTRDEIRSAIQATKEINGLSDSIIRITVTRGEQNPGMNINYESPPTVVISARPIRPISDRTYETGIAISLFKNSAPRITGIFSQKIIDHLACHDHGFLISEGDIHSIFYSLDCGFHPRGTNQSIYS